MVLQCFSLVVSIIYAFLGKGGSTELSGGGLREIGHEYHHPGEEQGSFQHDMLEEA